MNNNGILYRKDGSKRIADNTPRGAYLDDCRKPDRGKRYNGESCCELN